MRAWMTTLAAALALVSCGDDGGDGTDATTTTTTTDTATAGDTTATSLLDTALTSVLDSGADTSGDTTTLPPNGDATTTPSGRSFGPLDIVTDQTYTRLLVEIDVVTNTAPSQAVIDEIEAELAKLTSGGHLGKPGGIRFVIDETLSASPSGTTHSFDALNARAGAHRSLEPAADEASIYVLYTDGGYQDDDGASRILGFAYGGSVMVMLRDNIRFSCDNTSGVGGLLGVSEATCRKSEAYVFVHELGHLFGLVNNGLPMQTDHQDEAHGKHDDNERCIMFWKAETSDAVGLVAGSLLGGGDDEPLFDAECLADLAAVQ